MEEAVYKEEQQTLAIAGNGRLFYISSDLVTNRSFPIRTYLIERLWGERGRRDELPVIPEHTRPSDVIDRIRLLAELLERTCTQ